MHDMRAMPALIARTLLIAAVLLAAVGCGYDTSTTFNADGTVTVGLKFLLPKSLMNGSTGSTVQGMSPADIAKANSQLQSKYPGAKVTTVTEGDETGALISIPFKNEKDAFAFLTSPSTLKPSSPTSSSGSAVDLSNTGGLFTAANHTTSGQTDTYTFKTAAQPLSPSTSSADLPVDVLADLFTITFSLTVPHEITSATGALFTFDRKTAIWKVSLIHPQTLTATTGPGVSLTGFASNSVQGPNPALLLLVALVAVTLGLVFGMFGPWRPMRAKLAPEVVPPTPQAPLATEWPAQPGSLPGPPPGAPPPPAPPAS
jgi:hypothetical protein